MCCECFRYGGKGERMPTPFHVHLFSILDMCCKCSRSPYCCTCRHSCYSCGYTLFFPFLSPLLPYCHPHCSATTALLLLLPLSMLFPLLLLPSPALLPVLFMLLLLVLLLLPLLWLPCPRLPPCPSCPCCQVSLIFMVAMAMESGGRRKMLTPCTPAPSAPLHP